MNMTQVARNERIFHRLPPHPVPHHVRRGQVKVYLDETDHEVLLEVFGDEDTANAVINIIEERAPAEMQIVIIQLMDMIKEVA